MGQYWIIAALDSKKLLFNAHIKLGELLFEPAVAEDVERALAVPVVPTHHDSRPENVKSHHSAAGVGTMDRKPGSFSRFPTEIHRLIFEHCYDDDLKSVVFLGVTNQYFWSIAREYVVRDFTQTFGVWAGQQLITVGDYVKVDDYPPGLFATEEDKENLLKRRPEDEESEDEGSEDEVYQLPVEQQTLTLYERISRSFTRLPDARSTSFDRESRDYSILDALAQDPCYRTVRNVFCMECDDFYPRDEVWILRNLTTHQYVRREPLELQPGLAHGPFVQGIGFGCVVLSRISWSSDSSVALHDPTGRIHRGLWAGHRFDITTMTRHEKLTAGQNWADVTEELVEEVTAIWSAEMGPNWKQKVLEQQ
ncbi:hypothetical protein E4U35_003920 [Claviceps purpurea]|nr:hypothetical protein E4U37_002946 [Claviceps purpurea]KAG6160464.1 hypothetical protein E4U11_003967 [Claviceps purpurea]KAG6160465.1 hypothetical protein E4U51_007494 [Claviceps purpurea]KAG6179430.1 hypothetical protein E4U10_007882 [Claviceps purpurea]KAG6186084.1 hypothetical protein E4U36_000951 [Claviceps purpurea]